MAKNTQLTDLTRHDPDPFDPRRTRWGNQSGCFAPCVSYEDVVVSNNVKTTICLYMCFSSVKLTFWATIVFIRQFIVYMVYIKILA